jgi:hypothetical protein
MTPLNIAALVIGGFIVLTFLAYAFIVPMFTGKEANFTDAQYKVFRFLLPLGLASLSIPFTGEMAIKVGTNPFTVTAAGAFAIFVLVYLFDPASKFFVKKK